MPISQNEACPSPPLDRDKIREWLRHLDDERVFSMLYQAVDLLPDAVLEPVLNARIGELDKFRLTAPRPSLLESVQAFDTAARRNDYYESFAVNSRNCTESSKGTRAFIAEINRLLDRIVAEAPNLPPAETRESLSLLFQLLRDAHDGTDRILWYADDGGLWQFGIDWSMVLEVWFTCLARTASPEKYAREAEAAIDDFAMHRREEHLKLARRIAGRIGGIQV